MQGDEHVVGIAQPIAQILSASENPTDDMIKFPSDSRIFMSKSRGDEALGNTNGMSVNEEWLNSLHEKIMNWNPDHSMTRKQGLDEPAEYVLAVEEIQRLIESLGCLARTALLPRLKEEFSHLLSKNRQHLEPELRSSESNYDSISLEVLDGSADDEPSEDCIIHLVDPNIIPRLKCMAEVMFMGGYDAECCQAYVSVRKDALEECLLLLEVEKLSINDVLPSDWSYLNSKIKEWVRAVKIFIRVYLTGEKSLADKVFGVSVSAGQTCFVEASKGSILPLLSSVEAVAIRNNSVENIFLILYMYDGFLNLLPYIDVLFSNEAGSFVSAKARKVVSGLGESARRSLDEFRNIVRTNESSTPFARGGVHPLAGFVMNYLKVLADYYGTLNVLLKGGGDDHSLSSSIVNRAIEDDSGWSSSSSFSPMGRCLQSMISALESNLESKSRVYTDVSLRHFFLMNNLSYMAQEVKDSELQPLLGENWIREHSAKFSEHAANYELASWNPVVYFLRDEGIHFPQSGSVSKAILKGRFQGFNLAFEKVYGTQKTWSIHNQLLLREVRKSISDHVIPAYQSFVERYSNLLAGERHIDWYIKYSVTDLQEFFFGLFEWTPNPLCKSHRLVEQLCKMLIENRQPFEPEHLSFQSGDVEMSFTDLIDSVGDEPSEGTQVRPWRDNTRGLDEHIIDLVHPNAIPILKCTAEVMFMAGYDAECCQAYISIRKDALEECLLVLEVEKLSINDVLQMDWISLHSKIKKWVRAVKIFIHVYLASEKSLADKVFGFSGSVGQTCFVDASKGSILQLLSFGEAVSIRNHSPEKILLVLHMYDGFVDLLPVIDVLFSDEAGSFVSNEAHGVLCGLGESVTRTLDQFRNAVKTNESSAPFSGGGVHHLTRYVMKYLKALTNYSDTLNFVLKVDGDDHSPSSSKANTTIEVDGEWSSCHVPPVSQCLQSMISILESNLESKSQVYTDVSLQNFFLMNNLWYVAHKVKDSELQLLLGENWIRKHNGKFQQHAVNYERTSWSPVLSFLRFDGICNPRSGSVSKAILKERILGFNLAFEQIYKTQTAWLINDGQLQKELRISVSSKVLPAYRLFLERFSSHLKGKRYVKHSVEDLEEFLLDLFEGSPRSLHKFHRR